MNKTELINAIAEKTNMTKKDAGKALDAAVEAITAAMVAGDKVQLSGFGIFETKTRSARVCHNPQTGEAMEVPASRVPAFKASKTLKDSVAK